MLFMTHGNYFLERWQFSRKDDINIFVWFYITPTQHRSCDDLHACNGGKRPTSAPRDIIQEPAGTSV